MASKVLVLLAAAVALNTRGTSAAYSSEEAEQIVIAHNRGRSAVSPTAANMLELVWDADLALSAQQWADRCQNEHPVARNRDYTNIGQNLFIKADSSAADPPSPVMTPVRSWNSQAKDYTYINNSCAENCAEYKQVIWAETEKVGCGVKYCEVASTRSGTAYQNAWIVVCNYSPRADVIGAKPYIAGVPCSNCPSGMLCRNNVCYNSPQEEADSDSCQIECHNCGTKTSQCTCNCQNGYFGTFCENYCEDTDAKCGDDNGWPESQCGLDPNVKDKCPTMCGVCVVSSPTKNFKRSSEPLNAQEYLDEHNEDRGAPGACDMNTLTWDNGLAESAQACADQCAFAHCRTGENIYLTSRDSPAPTAEEVVATWYSEEINYNYQLNDCADGKMCGHYKQVVWAETSKVGCAHKFCDSIEVGPGNVWEGAWLAVCQYDPAGNVGAKKPYTAEGCAQNAAK